MAQKSANTHEIFWIYEVAINPGKFDDFVAVAHDIMATIEEEPGTVEYRYSMDAKGTVCHIYERYRDSKGLLAHAANFGRVYAERFMAACTPSRFSIYGEPDAEAAAALTRYGAVLYSNIVRPTEC